MERKGERGERESEKERERERENASLFTKIPIINKTLEQAHTYFFVVQCFVPGEVLVGLWEY